MVGGIPAFVRRWSDPIKVHASAADESAVAGQGRIHRLKLLFAREAGFSLMELIVVMAIMLIVIGAITDSFTSASRSEINVTNRQQAQEDARLAVSRLRSDLHCAYYVQSVSEHTDVT